MAKGEYIGTVAIAEAAGRFDADGIQLKASKSGPEYVLSGEKFFVPDAHVANGIATAVRTGGSGEKGITILGVPADAKGLTITQLKTVDMTRRLCHVKFDGVKVPAAALIGTEGEGWPILRRTMDIGTAALATELVGTAQKALDMSIEYAKTRVQFGKPIGSFQAVKHKCVDMMVAVENARSLAYYAAWTVDTKNAEAATAVPMAKAYASDMAKNVTSDAIQVHGGIGFTGSTTCIYSIAARWPARPTSATPRRIARPSRARYWADRIGLSDRLRLRLTPAIVVFAAFDVVLAEVVSGLHFDEDEVTLAGVRHAMPCGERNIN